MKVITYKGSTHFIQKQFEVKKNNYHNNNLPLEYHLACLEDSLCIGIEPVGNGCTECPADKTLVDSSEGRGLGICLCTLKN